MPAVRIKDHWREQRLFDQRALICAVIMGLASVGLVVRLFVLQVVQPGYELNGRLLRPARVIVSR